MSKRPALTAFVIVMILRVIAGLLFSLTLLGDSNQEGHMLILADLPALAVAGLVQVVPRRNVHLAGAFDPTYLACSLVGWLVVASAVALIARAFVRIRSVHS